MTAVVNTVDISEFQSLSDDDWQAMKNAGIQNVIIRATSSLRLDKLVKSHITAAKKFGFNWHLYHDWEGQTGEDDYAIKTSEELGLTSNQVLFFDMEGNHAGNWSDIFENFRKKASSHFKVGLYISESPYQSRFNDSQLQAEHVIRWIANYGKEPKNYDIWQKSGHGSGGFGSYTGDIDRDVDPNEILKVVADDPVKDYKPTAEDIMIRQIILQPGYDSETGVYGLGCSYDNGRTFRVYWTIYGQKFYQEDADRLWPFLKDKITTALSIDWDNIQNKPKFVTPDELETRLDKLSVPTVKWADIEDKPPIPSIEGLAKESELTDYAKKSEIPKSPDLSNYALKSELPSLKGYAKLTDIPSIAGLVKEAELADYAKKSDIPKMPDLSGYAKTTDIPKSMTWDQITGKPNLALSSDIPSLDGYAKLTDIPSVTGLVKETELSDYVRKSDLPTMPDLSGYATISSLIDYVKKTDLPDFTLFAKKSDIPAEQDLSNYVKKPDLNNYVTIDNLQTSLNNQNQVQTITSGTLADLANKRGSYHYEIECWPSDTPIQEWGLCDVIVGQHYAKQVFTVTGATDDDQGNVYVRVRDYSGQWHEWRELTAWN